MNLETDSAAIAAVHALAALPENQPGAKLAWPPSPAPHNALIRSRPFETLYDCVSMLEMVHAIVAADFSAPIDMHMRTGLALTLKSVRDAALAVAELLDVRDAELDFGPQAPRANAGAA